MKTISSGYHIKIGVKTSVNISFFNNMSDCCLFSALYKFWLYVFSFCVISTEIVVKKNAQPLI